MLRDAARRTIGRTKGGDMHGSLEQWMQFLSAGGTTVGLVLLALVLSTTLISAVGGTWPVRWDAPPPLARPFGTRG
jgi:hypothetical protein